MAQPEKEFGIALSERHGPKFEPGAPRMIYLDPPSPAVWSKDKPRVEALLRKLQNEPQGKDLIKDYAIVSRDEPGTQS